MYEIGSYVVYRSEGVCKISDIREESFGAIGAKELYYILVPQSNEQSTLFVPVNNEKLSSMIYRLLSADEINQLCAELSGKRMEWRSDIRTRNSYFRDILAVGDRVELILLANTVNDHICSMIKAGRKPGFTDINALTRAKKMLYEEFRVTTDIRSYEEIMPLLFGELQLKDKE